MVGDSTKAARRISISNNNMQDQDFISLINCDFSDKKDEQYYKSVIQDLRKINQINQFVKSKPVSGHQDAVITIIESLIQQKESKEQTNKLQGQLVKAIRQKGMMLDPNLILQLLDNQISPEDFMEQYKKLSDQIQQSSEITSKDYIQNSDNLTLGRFESSHQKHESNSFKLTSQQEKINLFFTKEVKNPQITQDDKRNNFELIQNNLQLNKLSFDKENKINNNQVNNINSKVTQQTYVNQPSDRQIAFDRSSQKDSDNYSNSKKIDERIIGLKIRQELKNEFEKFQNKDNKYYQAYNETSNQRDNYTKQQILKEICQDLIQTKKILCEMQILDSTNYITKKITNEQILGLRKKSAEIRTLTDREILNKRQQIRLKFNKFIMKDLVAKYARQAGVDYQASEEKIGLNLLDGATIKMNMTPEDYGKMARQIIVKIATLMIKHKIDLNQNNFKDFCKVAGMERNLPIPTGIFGWQIELAEHEDIRSEVNKLVNLVLDQIKDRQNTFTFPNAEVEDLIEQGRLMWFNEIDKKKRLIVPRENLDNLLVNLGVVQDYKSVNRFLAGALSGFVIRRHENLTFTQFMKLVNKAALRECLKNIVSYHQFGFDGKFRKLVGTEPQNQTISIGQQVMKLQRQILYQGVLSKNTIRQNEETKKDYMTYNQSCSSIVTNLQQLLQTPMIRNSDECKIKLEALIAQLQQDKSKLLSEIDLHLDFDVPSEWNNIVFGDYNVPNLNNIKYGINHLLTEYIEAKTTPENLKQKAIALKKKILKKLIDKNYVNKIKENPPEKKKEQTESFGFYSKVEDLPQVKQILASNYEKKYKQSVLKNLQDKIEVKSQIKHAKEQFSFGQPKVPILRDDEHFKIKNQLDRVSLVEGQLMASKISLHMLNTALKKQFK